VHVLNKVLVRRQIAATVIQRSQRVYEPHQVLSHIMTWRTLYQIDKLVGQLLTAAVQQVAHYVCVQILLSMLARFSPCQAPPERLQEQQLTALVLMQQVVFYLCEI